MIATVTDCTMTSIVEKTLLRLLMTARFSYYSVLRYFVIILIEAYSISHQSIVKFVRNDRMNKFIRDSPMQKKPMKKLSTKYLRDYPFHCCVSRIAILDLHGAIDFLVHPALP